MKNFEVEALLSKNGFTAKEISVIKQHAEKEGYPYLWLLTQLKKRFVFSCVLLAILLVGWVYTSMNGSQENFVSYSVMIVIGFIMISIFTPMKAGFKAYRLLRKKDHSL